MSLHNQYTFNTDKKGTVIKNIVTRLINVFVAILMVGMMVGLSTPQPVTAAGEVVDLLILPASQTVVNGDDCTFYVEARYSEQ